MSIIFGPQANGPLSEVPRELFTSGTSAEGAACPVCLDPLAAPGKHAFYSEACGHVYHTECIQVWAAKQAACPVCKQDLSPSDKKDLEIRYVAQQDKAALASLQTLPQGGAWLEDQLDSAQFPWSWHEDYPVRPLAGALYSSYARTAEFLLGLGADPNAVSVPARLGPGFISMLSIALFHAPYRGGGPDPRPDLLVRRGANVNEPGLLTLAALPRYSSDALTYLLQHGADPNVLDSFGWSPFYWAVYNTCEYRRENPIEDGISRAMMLLRAGADPTLVPPSRPPSAESLLITLQRDRGRDLHSKHLAALLSLVRRRSAGGVSLRSDARGFERARNL